MPAAEVDVTVDLVATLLTDQRPDLAHLEIRTLAHGWDNVSFRVGPELVARLPRRAMSAPLVSNEARWLPELAPLLPLPIPDPVFVGQPGSGYPWRWTIVPWIPGESAATAVMDYRFCAPALADFLKCLHIPAPDNAPANPFRGTPLAARDDSVRRWIDQLSGTIDRQGVESRWDAALEMPSFPEAPRWIHGDLHAHNLLILEGKPSGVIDFGDVCGGDPATDLAIAWTLFPRTERSLFQETYGGDRETWHRAHGWALLFSLAYLANSADNPTMYAIGVSSMGRVLEKR